MAGVKHYQAVPFAGDKIGYGDGSALVEKTGPGDRYTLGEGPIMDWRTGILSFVDITEGRFYRILPDGRKVCFEAGQPLGAAIPALKPGTYIFAATDGLYRFAAESMTRIADLRGYYNQWQRSNDAKADPAGRLFFGAISNDKSYGNNGNLFCMDPAGGGITVAQAETKISNGMAWDSSRKKFFFSDSLEYAVFVYDYDVRTGQISNRKKLYDVEGGVPDGMCIDANDCLWVAVWGGKRIEQRDSVTGELLAVIDVPAEHVSSCCFMSDDTLFITSSAEGLQGQYDGCLFTCKIDAVKAGTDYCGF